MPSDDMNGAPVSDPSPGTEGSAAVRIATGEAERSRRRKLAILALLLLVLAMLAYTVYYFAQNRRLPLPQPIADATVLDPPQYLYSISGTDNRGLNKPLGIAVGRNGRVYAVDTVTRTIKAFTVEGSFLFAFGQIDDGANKVLANPVHLAVDPSGNIWVTDRTLDGIYVFDADGRFVRKFAPGGDPAFDYAPLGVYVDATGYVYVTEVPAPDLHRILVFDDKGRLKTTFGQGGQGNDSRANPGVFSFPNGIVVTPGTGPGRYVYIADSNNRRVQVYTPDGSFRRMIPTEGTPRGLAMDSEDRLYVVNVLSHQVDIYSTIGQRLATFGESGIGPGQFQYPEDVAIDANGRIYVTDRANNQIQVWGFPKAEIPGITRIEPGKWWLCLLPLPLLLVPLFFRKRRFVVTEDFVEGMVTAELVPQMVNRRWVWLIAEAAHSTFVDRTVDGVDLGALLVPETYSHSDAKALSERLGVALDRAGVLAMAKRARVLCTEDTELGRLAVLLGVDAYDRAAFVRRFIERGRR
jgi:DNA-binding beta-propeller fold protein YncE